MVAVRNRCPVNGRPASRIDLASILAASLAGLVSLTRIPTAIPVRSSGSTANASAAISYTAAVSPLGTSGTGCRLVSDLTAPTDDRVSAATAYRVSARGEVRRVRLFATRLSCAVLRHAYASANDAGCTASTLTSLTRTFSREIVCTEVLVAGAETALATP